MSDSPIRVVFLGTPMFSVPGLKTLLETEDIQVIGVLTQPDRPSGRGQKLTPPPIKELALEHNLPVHQPKSLKKDAECIQWLKNQQPDFLITIAFGQILSQEVLDIPKYGTVNVHASLLPEYRGPNPIQYAVLEGKTETGLTTMLTDIGVDTGDMLLKETIAIDENITTGELTIALSNMGGNLLVKTLRGFVDGSVEPTPQDHDAATHAPKLTKDDAVIDWNQSAQALHNKIRAQQPWPGTLTYFDGSPLKTSDTRLHSHTSNAAPGSLLDKSDDGLLVQTGEGVLEVRTVQPAGKAKMRALDWVNGALQGNLNGQTFEQAAPATTPS